MKIYLISGETSGDQHAADLIYSLKRQSPELEIRGVGGRASLKAGLDLFLDQKEMAVMGFAEVLSRLNSLRKILSSIKKDIEKFAPDKIVLIDFPGMNLRLAKFAHKQGIQVHYYIAPKVWAWKEGRLKQLKKYVDRLYCILPFEQEYFANKGMDAAYIGNPSKIKVDQYLANNPTSKEFIALLPGSRKQEILANLEPMIKWAEQHTDQRFLLSQAPGFEAVDYPQLPSNFSLESDMYKLLSQSKFALVTSGTATLETALFSVPQIVCYRTSNISYFIGKLLVKLKFISLVNLILNKEVLPELIQSDFSPIELEKHYQRFQIIENKEQLSQDLLQLRDKLGEANPSVHIAEQLLS